MPLRRLFPLLAAALLAAPHSVSAAVRTVVLTVEKVDCALCAPIVRKALERTRGVTRVKVVEASPEAPARVTVSYEDRLTDVKALVAATTNAGYPSHITSRR